MEEKLIEIIEKIKYLSEDTTELGWLGPQESNQINRICEDALIKWQCKNARIERLEND